MYFASIVTDFFAVFQICISAAAYRNQKETMLDRIGFCVTVVYVLMTMGVFTAYHVVRFSHGGKVCAGDYLA
jgi:hypothetical protein